MLEYLITSKTRVKLLLKFFLNPEMRAYLRSLAQEFGESTNAVRVELNRLTEAGLLKAENEGRTKLYQANRKHALFDELHSIVRKYIGIDRLVEEIVSKLGNVKSAFIVGDYAKGVAANTINLIIVGDINLEYMQQLAERTEKMINRTIHVQVWSTEEFSCFRKNANNEPLLIVWGDEN